jgi:hypothetical protein
MYAAESTNYRRLVEALQKLRKPVTSNSYLADFEVASDRFRPLLLDRPARLAQSRYVLQASGIALRRMKPGWRRSASLCERSEPKTRRVVLPSARDDDGGGFSMFAPLICRRRWRNNAFGFDSSDEDGANPANIAASGANNPTKARCASRTQKGQPYDPAHDRQL